MISRRTFAATALALLGGSACRSRSTEAAPQPKSSGQPPSVPQSGTRLLLLGTQGGPNFSVARGEQGNAVLVGDRAYLFDCGYGTLAGLIKAGVNHREIAQVFLTHLHDDHTADLPALLTRQWTNGRKTPTTVYGPYGTTRMVDAVLAFGEANAAIRLVDEARSVKPADIMRGRDLAATQTPAEAYRDDRVTVRSVENTHYPDDSKRQMPYRSLSYRIDTSDRSIVFSGDTAYSTGLVALAKKADILVCETIEVAAMRKAFDGMVARGMYADNPEGIWRHIIGTHTPVEDAGRMAAEAGVGTLVLSHLVPGALGDLADDVYIGLARKTFAGRVVVGRDQLTL